MNLAKFNQLSPAEEERLYLLLEELGEAQQAIGKVLRFGYQGCQPEVATNRGKLEGELGDVVAVLKMLVDAGDLSQGNIDKASESKLVRVKKYLRQQ